MNTVNSTQPALIVDWTDVTNEDNFAEWLISKQDKIAVILFVPDPEIDDFEGYLGLEPAVVLRNNAKKPLPDIAFKTAAILAVQDSSNLRPVAAFDTNEDVLDMYEEAGVVVTASPEKVDKVMGLR